MDGGGPDPLALELLDEAVGAALGADEDEGLGGAPADGGRHLDLVHLVDLEEAVLHGLDGGGGPRPPRGGRGRCRWRRTRRSTSPSRVAEKSIVWWRLLDPAQHPVDLGQEAHVGHAVGLVEDDHLDVGHRDLAAVGEVDEPAGGGDDDVDALVELLDLALDVGAAVDDDGPAARRRRPGARGRRPPGWPAHGWGRGRGPRGRRGAAGAQAA